MVGLIGAVNESTWEHLKLLFYPFLLVAVVEYFIYGKKLPNFLPVKVFSVVLGMMTIVVTFYLYTAILGQNYLWLDILVFLLGVAVAFWASARLLTSGALSSNTARMVGFIALLLLLFCFIYFTFSPPEGPLFLDPVTGGYGIPK